MVNPYWQIVEILSTNPGYESDGIVENFQQKTSIYGKSSTQYNCEHIEFDGFLQSRKSSQLLRAEDLPHEEAFGLFQQSRQYFAHLKFQVKNSADFVQRLIFRLEAKVLRP